MRAAVVLLLTLATAAPAWGQKDEVTPVVRAALDTCLTPGAPGLAARVDALIAQGWALASLFDADQVGGAEALYLLIRLVEPSPSATEAERADALERARELERADFLRRLDLRMRGEPVLEQVLVAHSAVAVLATPIQGRLVCRIYADVAPAALATHLRVASEDRSVRHLNVTAFAIGDSRMDRVERIAFAPGTLPGAPLLPLITTPQVEIID